MHCIDPHFLCFRGKIGGYSILQLCACSRSLGTLFELLSATIGPQASLLRYLDLPIANALWGEKLGQHRGRGRRILTPTKAFLLFGPQLMYKISSKSSKNCDPRSADRQTDRRAQVVL